MPKPSNNFQSDRPESGGADHNSERENSGLLERDKQKYAADHATKRPVEPSTPTEGSRDGESEQP
jgi:hypothetical protein